MLLLSQDYGKHLLGVEDLLQKHALVEADIGIQVDRVRNVNSNAQKFAIDTEGETNRHVSVCAVVGTVLTSSLPPQVINPVILRSSGIESLTWISVTRS